MDRKGLIVPRVGVILIKDDKILLVKSTYDSETFWVTPGGGLEFEESMENCAIREVKEETGLDIRVEKLLYLRECIPNNKKDHVVDLIFQGNVIGGELITGVDPDKEETVIKSVEFIPLDKMNELKIFPKCLPDLILQDKDNNFKDCPKYLGVCD